MFRRIVVPLDGSELAERALPRAEELSRLTGAPIHLLRVVDVTVLMRYGAFGLPIEYAAMESALAEERAAAREYLDRIGREVEVRGVSVTTELRERVASRELLGPVRPDDPVVMASHGRGGLARWFLGSVAEEVVRRSQAPVLLVRSFPVDDASAGRDRERGPEPPPAASS